MKTMVTIRKKFVTCIQIEAIIDAPTHNFHEAVDAIIDSTTHSETILGEGYRVEFGRIKITTMEPLSKGSLGPEPTIEIINSQTKKTIKDNGSNY